MSKIELRRNKAPKLSRRSFLAGSGIAMSLPLMEAMLPTGKTAFAADGPSRILSVHTGNGIHMQTFTPSADGRNYSLPQTLEPLSKLKNKMMVLTGIQNSPAKPPGGVGDHGSGSGGFLTCSTVNRSTTNLRAATSMDQVIAQNLNAGTKFQTIDLSVDGNSGKGGNCDSQYSCIYLRNLSWTSPTNAKHTEGNPRTAFDNIFKDISGGGNTGGQQQAQISELNKSVIDSVLSDVNRLEKQLGATDREKLQEYLTGIRDIERQLDNVDTMPVNACSPGAAPASSGPSDNTYRERTKAFSDIIAMAFQCDLSRVATYMMSKGLSGRVYKHLGHGNNHHNLSHHAGDGGKHAQLRAIDKYHMSELAYLCEKLDNMTDVTGQSILDSTVVYYSSEISDGNAHNHDNLPILLIGSCNGYFDVGRHVKFGSKPELGSLYLSFMDAMGVRQNRFGISSSPLSGITT